MELLAVRRARLLAFLNAEELNPRGRPLAHEYVKGFIERYKFLKYPQTPEELLDHENKGYNFELGKWGDVGIDKMSMFDWGVAIDTSLSTDASESILQDALDWGAETFGTSNRSDLVTRRAYVSELVFRSDMILSNINPKLEEPAARATETIAATFGLTLPYQISGISFHFDISKSKQFFAPVRIERLENSHYSDKKYYSGAPLPTDEHLALITEFEKALQP